MADRGREWKAPLTKAHGELALQLIATSVDGPPKTTAPKKRVKRRFLKHKQGKCTWETVHVQPTPYCIERWPKSGSFLSC